jgi:autotransporter-associated beta strand protein
MQTRTTKTQTAKACHIPTILALSATLCGHAFSQTASIASGNWSSNSTWNTNAVPTANPTYVTANSTVTFQEGDSFTGGYAWLDGQFGVASGPDLPGTPGTGTLNITGGNLTTGAFWAGHGGTATINQSGGTLNIGGQHMLFGWNYGSSLNVSGGTMNMVGSGSLFRIGHTAQSYINITSNGVANLSGSGIDLMANSQINVNGGTLNLTNTTETNSIVNVTAGSQVVVQGGGALNLLSGTQTIGVAEGFYLGFGGTTGTLNISGGTWQQNTYMRLGVYASGNGIINQSGGTFEMNNDFEAWGNSPSAYNLQGGTFRTTADGVAINSYSGGAMTFNITGSSGNVTMDTPYDFTAPNSSVFNNAAATLTKTGAGNLTVSGALEVRNGALAIGNGRLETASSITIGGSSGSANATISAGTLKTGYLGASNLAVGFGGTGSLTQSNGTVDVGSQASSVIGWNAGGSGTYTLSGGNYSAANNTTYIGLGGGTGTVNVNGGSFSASQLEVGGNGATAGTLNLNGGTFGVSGAFNVGSGGTVNVNSGGTMSGGASNNVSVGAGGLVNFNGGTGNSSMNLFLSGGTVDVNGQTLAANTWANLIASGSGAVLRNSSATAASIGSGANTIWIWDGAGNLTVDTSAGNLQIDSRVTSSGQATQTGLIKTGNSALSLTSAANDYTGTTAVNAGILVAAHANALGSTSGGTTVASGAQLRLQGVTVGNEALTISGNGTGSSTGALRSGTGTNTYQGKVTLAADAKIFSGSGTSMTLAASGDAVDLASYTLTIEGAGTHTVSGAIVGTGGLTKIGSGTTTLAGTNTYSGLTTVSVGTLAVNGSVAGAMSVASGATLQGSGTISGATTVSGNLKPGNSPGLLTFANSLTLDSTATTTMEITGANSSGTRGTTYDAVNVANALTYGGTLALNFDTLFTQTGNYTFNLFDSASMSGSFGSVSLAGAYSGSFTNSSGIWGRTDGDNTWSFNQSDGVLSFAVVPEPNVAMVAGSLALMALLRRRRD